MKIALFMFRLDMKKRIELARTEIISKGVTFKGATCITGMQNGRY